MKILFLMLGLMPVLAHAADSAKMVKPDIAVCENCHGKDGAGNGDFPRLAGMGAPYLVKQLQDFRSGKRVNQIMQPIAKSMSESDFMKITEYFSGLPVPALQESTADAALLSQGESLAVNGDWAHGIPACFQCHGARGQGIAPEFPAIVGQSAGYISNQIASWKSGTRTNDPVGLMKSVSDKLSDDQIKAVSAYLTKGGVK
jgi:cytochrome c553